jgi:L-amino acid N-acyltransferase YncA
LFAVVASGSTAVKVLIDTNILIALEPTSGSAIELGAHEAAAVARLIHQSGNQIVVHPHVLDDLARDEEQERRRHREYVLHKYPVLDGAPPVPVEDERMLGAAAAGSNDWVDNNLLVAVKRDAVDYLITQDNAIHSKAARYGIADRVLTTEDALAMLRELFPTTPEPPPAVRSIKAHGLREDDPIFDSFRTDYADFDDWLRRCKRQDRPTWVIDGGTCLAAVCIAKSESDAGHGMRGNILKVCSLKVSDAHLGARFGELLLKTLFIYADENSFDWMYVTVFDRHAWLVALLGEFGFVVSAQRSALGELVMVKCLVPDDPPSDMTPLTYAVQFGPCRWSWNCANVWIVPIQPRFEHILFPERQEQFALFNGQHPSGNAIRKAYLCNAQLRSLEPGDVLAFYRSTDSQGIRNLGIVENWNVSDDPAKIQKFVARRTVYSFASIQTMAADEKEILAIRFRQVLHDFTAISFSELLAANVIAGAPQTIVRARREGLPWLKQWLSR